MEQIIMQSTLEEVTQPVILQEMEIASSGGEQVLCSSPSYRPTPWAVVNNLFDYIDKVTKGRAGLLQRFCTYLFIGGFAALVNLVIFFLFSYSIKLPVNSIVQNVIASVLACEISIMANFLPNDYFTFRHLSGHQRSWKVRCTRFHITSLGGSLLTFLLQFGFSYVGHMLAILSQAIALVIVLVYNFSFHHFFTYRSVKSAPH